MRVESLFALKLVQRQSGHMLRKIRLLWRQAPAVPLDYSYWIQEICAESKQSFFIVTGYEISIQVCRWSSLSEALYGAILVHHSLRRQMSRGVEFSYRSVR